MDLLELGKYWSLSDTTAILLKWLSFMHRKTSICKAAAHKIFIRNYSRYESGILLDINAHSLLSKFFAESGKLIMSLFNHIQELAKNEKCMVFILIDEVESITSSRSASAASAEPGDAVRAVNAVLTSLDALRRRSNVLILCTSNMLSTLDEAFIDRVDLHIYIGPPSFAARYDIIRSCCMELMRKGIIVPRVNLPCDVTKARAEYDLQYSGVDFETLISEYRLRGETEDTVSRFLGRILEYPLQVNTLLLLIIHLTEVREFLCSFGSRNRF